MSSALTNRPRLPVLSVPHHEQVVDEEVFAAVQRLLPAAGKQPHPGDRRRRPAAPRARLPTRARGCASRGPGVGRRRRPCLPSGGDPPVERGACRVEHLHARVVQAHRGERTGRVVDHPHLRRAAQRGDDPGPPRIVRGHDGDRPCAEGDLERPCGGPGGHRGHRRGGPQHRPTVDDPLDRRPSPAVRPGPRPEARSRTCHRARCRTVSPRRAGPARPPSGPVAPRPCCAGPWRTPAGRRAPPPRVAAAPRPAPRRGRRRGRRSRSASARRYG